MLGESLEKTFSFLKRNFSFAIGIWIVATTVTSALSFIDQTSLKDNSVVYICLTFLGAFLNIWLFVSMIHRIRTEEVMKSSESLSESLKEGILSTPGYVLIAIGYTLIMVLGLFFLIIPGIYFAAIYVFAPTLTVLDLSGDESTFTHSKELIKNNFGIGLLFAVLSILLEISSQLIMTIGQNIGISSLFYIPAFAIFMAIGVLIEGWSTFTIIELIRQKKVDPNLDQPA